MTSLVALSAATLTACGDDLVTVAKPSARPSESRVGADTSAASRAAGQLARALAIALADPGLRMRVLAHLRDSPFPKHALHAESYLNKRGAALLARAAHATGRPAGELLGTGTLLRGFQLVAPYTATRALWTGDSAGLVIVGSGLTRAQQFEAGAVTGYRVGTGEAVSIPTTRSRPCVTGVV